MSLLNFRSLLTVSFFILSIIVSSAQGFTSSEADKFNRWSIEVSAGVHAPIKTFNIPARSKYIAFNQFELAGRYMFTEKIGIKGHYGFNSFVNSDDTSMGLTMNRVGLEGVFNVDKILNINYRFRERLGLLFHTGIGVTVGKSSSATPLDHMGNFLVGFTGQYKLNDRLSLIGDMTYIMNFKQNYAYSGQLFNPENNPSTNSFVNVSVGIMYSLGQNSHHADWY